MLLYRPSGLAELQLVAKSGWRQWPPRLPSQPIFYPVLSFDYARSIARDWNPRDESSGFVGFVTRFQLDAQFAERYPVQLAGGGDRQELWVPAQDLPQLNAHIRGFIETVEAFRGDRFEGEIAAYSHLPSTLEPPRGTKPPLMVSCPCCRCLTLRMRAGFDLCPVCFWEDDGQDDPDAAVVRGGPNGSLSLAEARENFARIGACEPSAKTHVRPPTADEKAG